MVCWCCKGLLSRAYVGIHSIMMHEACYVDFIESTIEAMLDISVKKSLSAKDLPALFVTNFDVDVIGTVLEVKHNLILSDANLIRLILTPFADRRLGTHCTPDVSVTVEMLVGRAVY